MITSIFLSILAALFISDIYIFIVFIRKFTKKKILRILWFLPTILLLLGCYFLVASSIDYSYRNIFVFIFSSIALPKIFFTFISFIDLPFRYFFNWRVYPFTIIGLTVSLSIVYIISYGSTLGKTHFDVKQIEFNSPRLPISFDGYKIVQISDLHIGNWHGETESIKELVVIINSQNADAVMITGDLVNTRADELNGYEDILAQIKAKDGVYSILGNHDYGSYYKWQDKDSEINNLADLKKRQRDIMSWNLLTNENSFIKKGKDSIAIIGVENAGSRFFPDFSNLSKARDGINPSLFQILLSHDPTHWRGEVLNTNIDLMLAGHTHGGQLAIGNVSPAQFYYPEWSGLYTRDNQGLYVNVGIGFVGLPFRFGAFPEITAITLRHR